LLAASLYQGNPDSNHKLWNIVYTPYAGAAGMLLHIYGKFTMEKLKLKVSFLTNPQYPISRCMSRYEADLSVYVISFILSSMGYMRSTKSPNLDLFSERTSSI
jgi:hypothetical protein